MKNVKISGVIKCEKMLYYISFYQLLSEKKIPKSQITDYYCKPTFIHHY